MLKYATSLLLGCLLFGCGAEAPELSNLQCTPQMLSATPPGPYHLDCTVAFDGEVGDVSYTAYSHSANMIWASGFDSLSSNDWDGSYDFRLSSTAAPPLGMTTISVLADHIQGIDGPGDDEITTLIEVVP